MSAISRRRAVVKSLAEERFTVAEIAGILGQTYNTVHSDFKVLGLESARSNAERYWAQIPRIIDLAAEGKLKSEIANLVGLDATVVGRIAVELDIPIRKKSKTHGRVSTYRSGCGCKPCEQVGRNYFKRQRLERFSREMPERAHGTFGGYANWGCKCYPCRVAVKRKNVEAARIPISPVNVFAEWTPEEEALISDYSLTAKELAIKLKRSVHGVNSRRRKLKRLAAASR